MADTNKIVDNSVGNDKSVIPQEQSIQNPANQQNNQDNSNNATTNVVELPPMTPEQQKAFDAKLAQARRDGESSAEAKAKKAQDDAKEAEEARIAKEKGDIQSLLVKEENKHKDTQAKLNSTVNELNQLKSAIEAGVPNPTVNAKRIVGSTYEEMLEDAKVLASSFTNNAYNNSTIPPVVPNVNDGGRFQQQIGDDAKKQQDDVERNRQNYQI